MLVSNGRAFSSASHQRLRTSTEPGPVACLKPALSHHIWVHNNNFAFSVQLTLFSNPMHRLAAFVSVPKLGAPRLSKFGGVNPRDTNGSYPWQSNDTSNIRGQRSGVKGRRQRQHSPRISKSLKKNKS